MQIELQKPVTNSSKFGKWIESSDEWLLTGALYMLITGPLTNIRPTPVETSSPPSISSSVIED